MSERILESVMVALFDGGILRQCTLTNNCNNNFDTISKNAIMATRLSVIRVHRLQR